MAKFDVDVSINLDGSVNYSTFDALTYDAVIKELLTVWEQLDSEGLVNINNEFFLSASLESDDETYDFHFNSFHIENGNVKIFFDFDDGLCEETWSENGFDTTQKFSTYDDLMKALFL